MFEEEYKKKYNNLHPSAEVIEKTKKRALEAYKQLPEEPSPEYCDMWEEENSKISRNRRWIRVVGGMAAGIAIVATGVYLGNSLQPESQKEHHVAKNIETPEVTLYPKETTKTKKEEKKQNKKHQVEKKDSIETNASSDAISKIAQMAKGSITIDYASESRVIFHGDFGIMVYSISERRVTETLSQSQYDEDGSDMRIKVNTEGTKLLFYVYNEETLTENVTIYEIGSGIIQSVDTSQISILEQSIFGNVQSVAGTEADVYINSTGEMVSLGNNRYLQLMYQVPTSSLQASLSVAIIDLDANTEQLYSVFGSTGKSIEENRGRTYGNYHNEHGIALFEVAVDEEDKQQENEDVEIIETELPKQTEEPEVTTPLVEETLLPTVLGTELPQEPQT